MRVEFTIYPASPSVLYVTESLTPPDWKPMLYVTAPDRTLTVGVEIGDRPREFFKTGLVEG